ncbi:lactonase family protein [Larsenimonas suaedae]|uniref:Lactonase family protein n=1 Tax=Larsenimonas suaedae TaxID=1851019 RepID=A0ABU1GTC1_9GAMM|nr:lactonase family protein [Larsenimonas suaedae]MCM2971728.1 lactonase family protein [Larsenimonas suaedae]MDR5895280.1 lactonase family protein [Larsenimonas suaedae]
MPSHYLLGGTYTTGDSEGIYCYPTDAGVTALGAPLLIEADCPSFLTLNAERTRMYAVNEVPGQDGSISAFELDADSGQARLLGQVEARGEDPCHIMLTPNERFVVVSNYSGGSIVVYALTSEGALGDCVQHVVFDGDGARINAERQTGPHLHSCVLNVDGDALYACDLGRDRLYRFDFDETREQPLGDRTEMIAPPGCGPRHLKFHPGGRFAYLVGELDGSVIGYRVENDRLIQCQIASLAPNDDSLEHGAAELQFSPDGQFLYVSNRGQFDELICLQIDADGMLSWKATTPSGGQLPRHFTLVPDGSAALVGNQQSGEITRIELHDDGSFGNSVCIGRSDQIAYLQAFEARVS